MLLPRTTNNRSPQGLYGNDEDDKVYEGDLCTIGIILDRENLKEVEKAGLIHAPRFPYPKMEAWWIVLGTKEGKIISIEKVYDPKKSTQHQNPTYFKQL